MKALPGPPLSVADAAAGEGRNRVFTVADVTAGHFGAESCPHSHFPMRIPKQRKPYDDNNIEGDIILSL